MSTSPPMPLPQSQEQITFDVSPPFFKDGCSLNPSTYNPSADQVNYWIENSGNIMELYGNGFPTTCNPSPLEDIYYSLSGFITLINGNSVLIKPGGFLHQVTGDSSVTWNLDMKFESSSGTVYTFSNLKGIVGTNGLMNITSGTTSNGYGEFKQPTNEGTVQLTNLVDDAGNVFTTYDDAIKLANYDPTTGNSTDYVICSRIPTIFTKCLSGSYSNQTFSENVKINESSTFKNCTFNGTVTINESSTLDGKFNVIFKGTNNFIQTRALTIPQLTIGDSTTLTNSGTLNANFSSQGKGLPPNILVKGTLKNEIKGVINTKNALLSSTPGGPTTYMTTIKLETDSTLKNNGTLYGILDKETGSTFINNGIYRQIPPIIK
jgi:hypothetical protein